jgi:hypothetical protein
LIKENTSGNSIKLSTLQSFERSWGAASFAYYPPDKSGGGSKSGDNSKSGSILYLVQFYI